MARFPIICLTLTISSCCTVDAPIGVPERPELIPITQDQWTRTPIEVQDIISVNDLSLKQHIRRLEARIKAHDEAL